MEFVVSRDPILHSRFLFPFLSQKNLPSPVKGRPTTYHFWARNALFHGLRVLGLKPGDSVLVPAFHCRTVVDPVLQYGCKAVFYNVHRDGSVDFEDITRKIDCCTKAIVAIHYFGVLQPVHQLREFCQQYELFLIEDCAHVLMGDIAGTPIGGMGDISIFSWRKFFPLYDGGLLVCNTVVPPADMRWERLGGWFHLKIVKNLIEKFLRDTVQQRKCVSLHSYSFSTTSETTKKQEENVQDHAQVPTQQAEFDYSQVNWPMSRWSKAILNQIDIPSVIQTRKANTRMLFNALRSMPDIQPWSTIDEQSICAWAFPIVISTRQGIHVKLRERGIQAFSWDGVIHPTLSLEKFPEAKFLYEHLVLLPNQQSLTRHEINLVIQGIKDVLQVQGSCQSEI